MIAIGAGLAVGAAGWLGLGRATTGDAMAGLQRELSGRGADRPARTLSVAAAASAQALAKPLFARHGAGSAAPIVRVVGLSRTPKRSAALLVINNGPAQWLARGETRDGVTLVEVSASRVLVETFDGPMAIGLGQTSTPPANPDAPVANTPGAPPSDEPPPGLRMPPPPADAPPGMIR